MPKNQRGSSAKNEPANSLRLPKVFISYSWTSPRHRERVRLWAERLIQEGIDVILDIYDLKEGHDKYSFMERMVTDPTVTHVLVVCDKAYSEKADAKKAGVGTESQIISREVYERVEQSKFIPVVCEFSADHEPFLPIFLKSRIWIDFSSLEAENGNWEKLVRNLYGKPLYQKPQLGSPPSYIVEDLNIPASPALGKFNTFKQALLDGRKGLNAYRRDFLSACIQYADSLRVRARPEVDSMGQKILEDCGRLVAVRDQIVDWVLLESDIDQSDDFIEILLRLLEELRELKSRPPQMREWSDSWFEAHAVFVYEAFLYIVAVLIRTSSFGVLHEVFTSQYIMPKSEQYGQTKFSRFSCFYGGSESLQEVLAPAGKRLLSPAAELVKRQANRLDIQFSDIMQAELLVLLAALVDSEARWYPQTLHYASQADFPFFVRAAQHRHFVKLATVTGINSADELRTKVRTGYERLGINQGYDFQFNFGTFWSQMNMDSLDSVK